MVHIGNDWDELLKDEFQKEYYLRLRRFLAYEYKHHTVYPDMYDIFNALRYTAYADVKVVLLGQDPYHGQGQAHGLCFSVQKGVTPPPSLQNIYAELHRDVGFQIPLAWQFKCMDQTRRPSIKHGAYSACGTGQFTCRQRMGTADRQNISLLNEKPETGRLSALGTQRKIKQVLLNNPNHLILTASHPRPLFRTLRF